MTRAYAARAKVRAKLEDAQARRREAVAGARRNLPSYTEEDLEDSTARFAAISAEAAAEAAAEAVAKALTPDADSVPPEPGEKVELPRLGRLGKHAKTFERAGKIAGYVAAGAAGFASFVHWVLGWF